MPSELYTTLRATSIEHIESFGGDEERIRAVRTEDYTQHYGFVYYATVARPDDHAPMSLQGLIDHLVGAGPRYEPVRHEVTNLLVDEEKRETAMRVLFHIQLKGVDEVVPYEVSWLLEMTEDGKKLRKATEFIDGFASDRIRELRLGRKAQ